MANSRSPGLCLYSREYQERIPAINHPLIHLLSLPVAFLLPIARALAFSFWFIKNRI